MNRVLQSDDSYDFPDKISKALKVEFGKYRFSMVSCGLQIVSFFC